MTPVDSLTSSLVGQFTQPVTQGLRDIERQRPTMRVGGGGANSFGIEAPSANPAGKFGQVLEKFVHDVDDKMKASRTERTKILTGESTNLHQAMIASQEASVAFTMMVEMRNKLVESYQELMRSQV